MKKPRIAILGTGSVGQSLGTGLTAAGYDVRMGSREPASPKVKSWVAKSGSRASAGTFSEAAAFGELVILATLWSGTHSALTLADPKNLARKTLLDATNPLALDPRGGPPTLAIAGHDSGGEQVQRWAPEARVVKAFNTVGNVHMVNPRFDAGRPDMFLCGQDAEAKLQVAALAEDLGWPTIDLGGLDAARLLEPLALMWIRYGFQHGTWHHAFKLLRR